MKLVITGKPDMGKTTLVHIMKCEYPQDVFVGLDAWDVLKAGSFPESNSKYEIKCQQRALYHLQVEMENIMKDRARGRLTICDSGTLDCLALWPDTADEFFASVHSSLDQELSRYDWVLQMNGESVSASSHQTSTPSLNPRDFWKKHPHFLAFPANTPFSTRCAQVAKVIRGILAGQNFESIQNELKLSNRFESKDDLLSSSC